MRLARSGGRWNARDELERRSSRGLWARRISRCVSPTWPTSYAHPRCLSFSSRPPFLSSVPSPHRITRARSSNFRSTGSCATNVVLELRSAPRQIVLKFTRLPTFQRLMIIPFDYFSSPSIRLYPISNEIIHRARMIWYTRYILLSRKCDRYGKPWMELTCLIVCRNTNNVSRKIILEFNKIRESN